MPSNRRDPVVNKTEILVPMSLQSSEEDETLYYNVAKFRTRRGHFSWKDGGEMAFQMGLEEWISLRDEDNILDGKKGMTEGGK